MIRHIDTEVEVAPPAESYAGLRMTADDFLALPEGQDHYELVDGVVVMSPSPELPHQRVIFEIGGQLHGYLRRNPAGVVVADTDVRLRRNLVYRPDLLFISAEKAARMHRRVTELPDLVVEVISPGSRGYDLQTKRTDYEAAGVGEYWVIDPLRGAFTFFVLRDGKYVEAAATFERFASTVLPGFELDLARVQALF